MWPEPPADDLMPLTPSLRLPVALLAALVLLVGCRAADAGRSVSGSLAAPVAPTTTTTSTTTVAPTTTVPELVFVAHRPVVKPDEVDRPAEQRFEEAREREPTPKRPIVLRLELRVSRTESRFCVATRPPLQEDSRARPS